MLAAFAPMTPAAQADPDPVNITIATTYQEQKQLNWCSAAASRIALTAKGRTPTQAGLAADLGLSSDKNGHGLLDAENIRKVLNARLGIGGNTYRYALEQNMDAFDAAVKSSMSHGYPVVYNVTEVAGKTFSAGHYITITGRRPVGDIVEYRISDPYELNRAAKWYKRSVVKSWNKYGRYTAYGKQG